MSDNTLSSQELLQDAERRVKSHMLQVKDDINSSDSIEIKTDSDGENVTDNPATTITTDSPDLTYVSTGGNNPPPDPIRRTPQDPLDPPGDDLPIDPPEDAEDWAEYVKKAKQEGVDVEGTDLDQPDPKKLEAHRECVEKLVEALMQYLLSNDHSDVHMGGFMEDFDVVQKAMTKVRSGKLLSDIEIHALNKIYDQYGRQNQ